LSFHFSHRSHRAPLSTLFPYTTLFRSLNVAVRAARGEIIARVDGRTVIGGDYLSGCVKSLLERGADNAGGVQRPLMLDDSGPDLDRKSTRLNSSHQIISYAVFCLTKKN